MKKIDVWFLSDIALFEERKLVIFKNKKELKICLIEKRKSDGKKFLDVHFNSSAKKVLQIEEKRILYKRSDILKNAQKKPYGWCYAENKEYKNGKIKHFRCGFTGGREEVL